MTLRNHRFTEDTIVAFASQVTLQQMNAVPWQSICRVEVLEQGDPRKRILESGTGWLVSRHTVITAAHVILDDEGLYRARKVRLFFPSINEEIAVIDARYPLGLTFQPSNPYTRNDVAALRIASPLRIPPIPIASSVPTQGDATIAGFPGSSNRRFVTHSNAFHAPDQEILLHQISTEKGQSGAPLVAHTSSGSHCVLGIQVAGTLGNPYNTTFPLHNVALNIDKLSNFITSYIQLWG